MNLIRTGGVTCWLCGANRRAPDKDRQGVRRAMTPIDQFDPATQARIIAFNLTGAFLSRQSSLRRTREGGSILLISSSSRRGGIGTPLFRGDDFFDGCSILRSLTEILPNCLTCPHQQGNFRLGATSEGV